MTREGLLLRCRNAYINRSAGLRIDEIKTTDFTIISNNCWGGLIYESYGIVKRSPTVGMYFMAEEYLKFVSDLKYHINECKLSFIDPQAAKHKAFYLQNKDAINYPIAMLGSVEIAMMHFHSKEEAADKWERRCQRINWDRMIVKMNDQNECSIVHARQFMGLPFAKKIFFTVKEWDSIPGITKIRSKQKECVSSLQEPFGASRVLNIHSIINEL